MPDENPDHQDSPAAAEALRRQQSSPELTPEPAGSAEPPDTPESAPCAEPADTPESAPCAVPLETLEDFIGWIRGRRRTLPPINAADQMFGKTDGCTPIAKRAHYLASVLADRLRLPGLPPRPTGPLDVDQVAAVLADLLTWARDAALANAGPAAVPANGKKLSKEALAVAELVRHPEWTDTQIAEAAGCRRTSLYEMPKFVAARQVLKAGKDNVPKGTKDGETGDVEAWEDD